MKNDLFKCVICLILVGFIILGNPSGLSRILLLGIRNEVIPLSCEKNVCLEGVMDEFIPAKNSENNRCIVSDYMDESCQIESYNIDETVDVGSVDVDLQTATYSDSEYQSMVQGGTENTSIKDNTQGESDIPVINLPANNLDIGINYSMEQLTDFEFLINNCYTVDSSTSITPEDVDVNSLLAMDMSVDLSGDDYKVLIYHSHGSEAFADSRPGVTEDSIIGVGDELTRILEEDYGIKTYHDRTVYDVIDGKLDRNYAYTNSGYGIDKILEEHPSIQVVLDIHRDGVRDEVRLVKTIDGKPTAQIMFFNGISRLNEEGDLGYLYNPNLTSNLSFSLKMHLEGKSMYGDLMRKIYVGGYCYNLDRLPRASLVEVGAQTNTVQEAKNAMIPLAAILYSVLTEK